MSQSGKKSDVIKRAENFRSVITIFLLTLIMGVIELMAPVDLVFQSLRVKMRAQPVSGDIVIVGLDEVSMAKHGSWPWKGDKIALLADELFDKGAKRVFVGESLPGQTLKDESLRKIINGNPYKMHFAVDHTRKGLAKYSEIVQAENAELVAVDHSKLFWGGFDNVPYAAEVDGMKRPFLGAALAGVEGDVDERHPIDYSYQVESLPFVSADDVLTGRFDPLAVYGKDIIFGLTSKSTDQYRAIGQDHSPRVAILALSAETLKSGKPITIHWFMAWILAGGVAYLIFANKLRGFEVSFGYVMSAVFAVGPVFLETAHVFVMTGPACALILMTTISLSWKRFAQRQRNRGVVDPVSGLRTINALRQEDAHQMRPLVVARVKNYTDIISTLPQEGETQLVKEVIKRLTLGVGGAELLQGEDGNFFWVTAETDLERLDEQFQAMRVIFRMPVSVNDRPFYVNISFGVDQQLDAPLSSRIANSLAAARQAELGNNCWQLHDPEEVGEKTWNLTLLGEMDKALLRDEIWVAFQPQIDLKTQKVAGVEALTRWTHATRGNIRPDTFITVAERHNRIDELTSFVIHKSLGMLNMLNGSYPNITASVNISPSSLKTDELFDVVSVALEAHQIEPHRLMLELTETMELMYETRTAELLHRFRELGVELSLDDYGTGLSTLEYLKKVPATELKIDRCFVKDICTNPSDKTVVRSTIELAHALNMKAVVEGIEDLQTLNLVTSLGADLAQGYYIGKPMPAEEFITWLINKKYTEKLSQTAC